MRDVDENTTQAVLGAMSACPAHLHFTIAAPGHEPLITHVFRAGDRYLDSAVVFGVRQRLVADCKRHEPDARHPHEGGYCTLAYDFVPNPAGGAA